MRGAARIFVALVLPLASAGCSKHMSPAQSKAIATENVEIGMTRAEVEAKFGFPQRIERVGATAFFFYTTSWYIPSFWISSRNPIAIANGKVVGMGKAYYASAVAGQDASAKSN